MRIVGGEWRGRRLVAPPGSGTRPTSDKVREAIFDVLASLPGTGADGGNSVRNAPPAGHSVLDLFAGSGGLGIEALSRGAASCVFVERNRAALRALHANLQRVGAENCDADDRRRSPADGLRPRVRVRAADVRRALKADALNGSLYTLVFIDPPYDRYAEVQPALVKLLAPVLAPDAVLVVEAARRAQVALPWRVVREKRYGDTQVRFLAADDPQGAEGAVYDDGETT